MATASKFPDETLKELLTIERTLWESNADVYRKIYAPQAVLVFPGVGRIDRETAVAAIHKENAEGRAWAEVRFDAICLLSDTARWIGPAASLSSICRAN